MDSAPTALLVGKIMDILENEAYSIAAVRDEVDEIKQELVSMTSFLEDVDGKKTQTEAQKAWVTSVRDLTSDVEDIIDEFMYHMYEQQSRGRFARWLHRTIHIPKNLFYRRKIANKLHKITKMIKAIPERNKRYALDGVVGTSWDDISKWVKNQAVSSLFINEDELVGIDGKKQTLTAWLLNEEQHLTVVSVVGMGGSGKTTLVAKTFTNETINRHFDSYAWITVSQTYVIEDLFRSLIKELHQTRNEGVPPDLISMGYRDLLQLLLNYLESKRYLVVLDDVWDIKLWREIRIALPDRQLGSRIMLTTRKEDIAFHCFGVESHVHCMQPLEKNEAWELFSRKSFSTFDGKCCPPELEKLAWELMEKCKGLPLAIIALGGLMSSKKSAAEWSKVYNGLNWHLTSHHLLEPVKSILLLSFNDLPYRLKHCFLYCSLFPEDYLIRRKRLIRLWIAEGFVEHARGVTPEQVADSYLMELIFRNMLQVVVRNETGRPKSCKMHDLMRELALSTSEKEKISVVYDGKEVLEDIGARHLSIQTTQGGIKSCIGMSRPRSFLVFVTGIFSFSFSKSLPSGFKLLRVLDLEDVQIDKLPHNLVYLFNLRYLSLKGTQIKELPKAIGLLRNLLTLNILNTKIEVLPRGISKLLNLRHLIMHRYTGENMAFKTANGTRVPLNISKLKKLEVLSFVESEGNIIRLIGNMTQLTRIGITNLKERDAMDLCDSIQKLKLLQYLALGVSGEEEFLDINALSSPPPHLRRLIFASKLQKVPPWFSSLQNLTFLYLHWTRLDGDLLPHIEELPCLGRLLLVNAYVGNELCFNRGFPKLTILELFNFPLLNKITIAEGVMTNLQLLTLGSCMELKALPQGFEYLSKLETLELLSVSMQLIESIQEGGVDHPKICYYFWSTSSKAPSNVCKLKKLQVLACVESEGNIVRLVGNMTQLTRIGITNVKERDETDLRVSIQKMKLLSYLSLIVSDEEEFLRINALPSPSPHLQNLTLAGKLELVPPWFCLLSLTFMNLHWSRLEEDLLPHIQGLPSLRSLILFNAYTGKELYFSSGFVNLVHLQLCNFPLLKKITIEQGVMKNLQFLMLDSCMELQTLPSGIEHLSNLETLQLGSVSLKLIESIQEGGVDRAKVQHLPDIDDLVRTLFGRFHESNAKS